MINWYLFYGRDKEGEVNKKYFYFDAGVEKDFVKYMCRHWAKQTGRKKYERYGFKRIAHPPREELEEMLEGLDDLIEETAEALEDMREKYSEQIEDLEEEYGELIEEKEESMDELKEKLGVYRETLRSINH